MFCFFNAFAYNHICVCLRVMLPHWCRGKGLRPFFLSAHAGIWLCSTRPLRAITSLPNTDMQFLFWLLLIFVWKAFLLCAHFVLHRWVMLQALLSVNSKWDGIAASLVDGLTSSHGTGSARDHFTPALNPWRGRDQGIGFKCTDSPVLPLPAS